MSVGSVSRIPATDIEDIIVKSANEHLVAQHSEPSSSSAHADDRGVIAKQVLRIDVHKDRLMVRFKSAGTEEGSHSTDGVSLSIPWQKPPSRKSRQILIPLGVPRNEVRPTRIERRARLVNAIARGRRWLDEIASGSATNVEQIATRQKCSARKPRGPPLFEPSFKVPRDNAHNQSSGFAAAPGFKGLNACGPLKVHPRRPWVGFWQRLEE